MAHSIKAKKPLKRWLSNKEAIKSSRFSFKVLILFVLVFGGLGAYLLFRSFAASPPANLAYGDLNGDNTVNVADLSLLLSNYGTTNAAGDINSDNKVNVIDLSILLSHYGTGVSAQTGILFGYQLHLSSQRDQAAYINLAVNGGAKTVRDDFEWSAIEPSNNNFQWSSTDNLVSQASKAGLSVLAMVGYSPGWATGCSTDKCGPTNNADYADVAAHVAQRYGHNGTYWTANPTMPFHPLVGIEVWNEPNLGFWTNPNPVKYTAMLKAAYPAIKAADPNMLVISAGLAPQGGYNDYNCDDRADDGGTSEGAINQINFLQAMYQNGAAGFMDAVGYHPYNWGGATAAHYFAYHLCSGWSQMADTPVSIRSLMVANGDGSKKIWSTEAGGPTTSAYLSDSEQALLATQIVAKWKALTYVGNFYWYDLRDDCSDSTNAECRFGTVRQDNSLKPSYNALKTAWQ